MRRAYKFRLYPTHAQRVEIAKVDDLLCDLWNAALQQRREAWERQRQTLPLGAQQAELKALREQCPQYAGIHFHLLQDVLLRVDRAYRQFFSRVIEYRAKMAAWRTHGADPRKRPARPGLPRFKRRGRYRSFMFKDITHRNGAAVVAGGKRVRIAGVGNVKFKMHRPIEG